METIDTATLVGMCPDPVIGVDSKGCISQFNEAAERLLGYKASDVIKNTHITSLYQTEADAKFVQRSMLESDDGAHSVKGLETCLLSREGRTVPIRLSAFMLANGNGSVGFFHDLTETKALENKLRLLSITDSLTGLHNQRHFYDRLPRELVHARALHLPLSLLCIDLDSLKRVNDRLGHLEGDRVLRDVAAAMRKHARPEDMAFRYGGDEFMMLLPKTTSGDAEKLAHHIAEEFDQQCAYSRGASHPVVSCASLSIGVTQSDEDDDRETIVYRADLGMYQAKHAGGRGVVVIEKKHDEEEAEDAREFPNMSVG